MEFLSDKALLSYRASSAVSLACSTSISLVVVAAESWDVVSCEALETKIRSLSWGTDAGAVVAAASACDDADAFVEVALTALSSGAKPLSASDAGADVASLQFSIKAQLGSGWSNACSIALLSCEAKFAIGDATSALPSELCERA